MNDKPKERTALAERLIELRKSKGLNQRQAAEAIGIDYQNYRKYETSSFPKEDVYIKIADFYGVTIDYLMGRTDKKSGGEKKITATYSEKDKNKSFIIRQPQAEIKVVEDDLGDLSNLEILMMKKFRKISNEDKNDVIQYLYEKKDL
ncbi:MAG: helix-turn-helix domain-containing protein [Eubacterium sp.]|nr:helix-turn-helix domain-containing protein [Eubacterium sp.]